MKHLLTILIFFSPLFCNGQNLTDQENREKRYAIFLEYHKKNGALRGIQDEVKSQNHYTIGINRYSKITKSTYLGVGIGLTNYKFSQIDYSISFGTDFDTLTGMFDPLKSYTEIFAKILQITIPIDLRFNILDSKTKLFISTGLDVLYPIIVDNSSRIQESGFGFLELASGSVFDIRTPNLTGSVNLGVELPISKNYLAAYFTGDYLVLSQIKSHGNTVTRIKSKELLLGLGIQLVL